MSPRHILIAEDEQALCQALTLVLRKAGYNVTKAEDGYDAYETIMDSKNGKQCVDLLITDVLMPRITGIELIKKLNRSNITLPVLIMSGFWDDEEIRRLQYKGYCQYIEKPFNGKELLQYVSKAFGNLS